MVLQYKIILKIITEAERLASVFCLIRFYLTAFVKYITIKGLFNCKKFAKS